MKLRYFMIVVVVIILIVLFLLGKRVDVRTNKHVAELDEELQEILYLGSLAPNSHNIQSWKIEIYPGENYLTICLDESRRLKVVNPKDRELYSTNHESAQGESFAKQGITTTKNQLDGCTGFVIVNSVDSAKELILCGMKTVDLWLDLTKDSISVQPISYAIECDNHRNILEKELGITKIQMILRGGYTDDYGNNAAIRRDLADYISAR